MCPQAGHKRRSLLNEVFHEFSNVSRRAAAEASCGGYIHTDPVRINKRIHICQTNMKQS